MNNKKTDDPKPTKASKKSSEHALTNNDLFKQYFLNKNTDLRNEIATRNQALVTYIVSKYYSSNKISKEIREEILQEGTIGLLSAIDGYDYRKGFKFSTYATWWIRQAVNNYLININPIIRVPSHIRTAQNRLLKKLQENERDFEDLSDEDAEGLDLSLKMLNSINSAIKSKQVTSLNKPIYSDGELTTLEDVIPSESPSSDKKLDKDTMILAVKEALKSMPEKRRMILLLRYDVIKEKDVQTNGTK